MNRSRWALLAASITVLALSWAVAGAMGSADAPDLGPRIVVDPSLTPVSDDGGLGGERVTPGGIGGVIDDPATGTAGDLATTPPAAVPDAPVAPPPDPPPAPPPADDDDADDDDDDSDDDDDDDEPGDPDDGDDGDDGAGDG